MRAAEKEVEFMEKQAREEAEKEGRTLPEGDVQLPPFKELQAKKRAEAERKFLEERATLENNLSDIEKKIEQIQKSLRDLDGVQTIDSFFRSPNSELSDKLTAELANIIATARSSSVSAIADEFSSQFPGKGSKKSITSKIESLSVKEKRDGDTAALWYVKSDKIHLLTSETKKQLEAGKKRKSTDAGDEVEGQGAGATGPGGEFVAFPEYDGEEEPHDHKKAFTLFCKKTRKKVKHSLSPSERKNKVRF